MNQEELQKYKKQLLDEKLILVEEFASERDINVHDETGDIIDVAESQINMDLANSLSDLDREKLHLIEMALDKIDAGTYGICEGTNKPIPKIRLDYIPWTRYSAEYADMLEKRRAFE